MKEIHMRIKSLWKFQVSIEEKVRVQGRIGPYNEKKEGGQV